MNRSEAQDQVAFLQHLINDSDRFFSNRGNHFIIWAIAICLGQLANYGSIVTKQYQYIWPAWAIVFVGGWVASIFISRHKKLRNVASARMYSRLWISIGITFPIIAVAGIFSHAISPSALNPIYAIILGMAYFVSAAGTRFRWFNIAAVGWWCGAILLFWVRDARSFIIMAILMVLFQGLPGIMLNKHSKSEA